MHEHNEHCNHELKLNVEELKNTAEGLRTVQHQLQQLMNAPPTDEDRANKARITRNRRKYAKAKAMRYAHSKNEKRLARAGVGVANLKAMRSPSDFPERRHGRRQSARLKAKMDKELNNV